MRKRARGRDGARGQRVASADWTAAMAAVFFRSFCTRRPLVDSVYHSILQKKLVECHDAALPGFKPIWDAIADAVEDSHGITTMKSDYTILDLASGHGEPAVTLAQRFPNAHVVASDSHEVERARAMRRIQSLNLQDRVEVQDINLLQLRYMAEMPVTEDEPTVACDVVTCSLGLFMLPEDEREACLKGIRSVLNPGGLFVASVWEDMVLNEMADECVLKAVPSSAETALPIDEEDPALPRRPRKEGSRYAPDDPDCLSDEMLQRAGLTPAADGKHHKVVSDLPFKLGKHKSDQAWITGLMSTVPTLDQLSRQGVTCKDGGSVFAATRELFEEEVERRGMVDEQGEVVVPMKWRLIVAKRPL